MPELKFSGGKHISLLNLSDAPKGRMKALISMDYMMALLKDIRVTMMTTIHEDGTLRSRPMATQDLEFDGVLWFFTLENAPKVGDVQEHPQVNLSYVKPDDERYVSISGTAQLVRDKQKIDELWKPFLKAWFPNGKDDPNLALLKVTVTVAEYWDGLSNKMVQLYYIAKSAATGKVDMGGENAKVQFK
jgi:general stress protein 26